MSQTTINAAGQPTGRQGQLADSGPADVLSGFNSGATAIPFGCAVQLDATDISGKSVKKIALQADVIDGISVFTFDHQTGATGDLDANGDVKQYGKVDVLQKGRIYVTVEEAVSPGDRAYVRAIADGGEVVGQWRKSADEDDTIDITRNAIYRVGAGIGGLAVVDVDFTIKAG